jgi:two-component sensor histidine kinase
MAKALRTWGVPGLADDVLLIVSELVTNAVQHALGSEIAFVATRGNRHLLIEVSDGSTAAPAKPQAITDNAEDGRGLALVEALASDWGWTPHEDGTKSTWAVIAISAEEHEYADCPTGTGVRP